MTISLGRPRGADPVLDLVENPNRLVDRGDAARGGDGRAGDGGDVAAVLFQGDGFGVVAPELVAVLRFHQPHAQAGRLLEGGGADADQLGAFGVEADHDADLAAVPLAEGLQRHAGQLAVLHDREHGHRPVGQVEGLAVLDRVVVVVGEDLLQGRSLDIGQDLLFDPRGRGLAHGGQGQPRQAADQRQDKDHLDHFFHLRALRSAEGIGAAEGLGPDAVEQRGEQVGQEDGEGHAVRVDAVHPDDDDHGSGHEPEEQRRDEADGRGRRVRGQEEGPEDRAAGQQVKQRRGVDRGVHESVDQGREQHAGDEPGRDFPGDAAAEQQVCAAHQERRHLDFAQAAQLVAQEQVRGADRGRGVHAEVFELLQGGGQPGHEHGRVGIHVGRPGDAAQRPAHQGRAERVAAQAAEDHFAQRDGRGRADGHQPPGGRGGQQKGEEQAGEQRAQVVHGLLAFHDPVEQEFGGHGHGAGQGHDPQRARAEDDRGHERGRQECDEVVEHVPLDGPAAMDVRRDGNGQDGIERLQHDGPPVCALSSSSSGPAGGLAPASSASSYLASRM